MTGACLRQILGLRVTPAAAQVLASFHCQQEVWGCSRHTGRNFSEPTNKIRKPQTPVAHSVVPNLASVHTSADEEIAIHANIHVDGKTQLWNRGAVLPGVKSLGVPIGQPDPRAQRLGAAEQGRDVVPQNPRDQRSPGSLVHRLLVAGVRPERTEVFADRHDGGVSAPNSWFARDPSRSASSRKFPLSAGGLGLFATHWASWVGCLRTVKERHPVIAEMIAICRRGQRDCAQRLVAGLDMPSLQALDDPDRAWASGICTLHTTHHVEGDQDGRPAFPPQAVVLLSAPPLRSAKRQVRVATNVHVRDMIWQPSTLWTAAGSCGGWSHPVARGH